MFRLLLLLPYIIIFGKIFKITDASKLMVSFMEDELSKNICIFEKHHSVSLVSEKNLR
jgi:hypothetical protein